MSNVDEQPVLWRASACAGEYQPDGRPSHLLSMTTGEAELRAFRPLLTDADCYFFAMLVNLSEASRYYYPLEPVAKLTPTMTVFVERIVNRWHGHTQLVALVDIALEGGFASASIVAEQEPHAEIGPVAYKADDGIWDIVLKLLRSMFPGHRGP